MFIGIDWGTTKFRARLLDVDGVMLDMMEGAVKLSELGPKDIATQVSKFAQRWPSAKGPMLMAGMIGSSIGWQEVPHVPCPATLDTIASGFVHNEINGHQVVIIPGLKCTSRFGDHDLMRGEEIVAAGLMVCEKPDDALLLSAPGMHGKWIEIRNGAVTRFHTSMTVELATILAQHSFLASGMNRPPRIGPAFMSGVDRGFDGGGLARLLFTARTGAMEGIFETSETASYVWGLLIGSDIREIDADKSRSIYLSGDTEIIRLFAAALSHVKINSNILMMEKLYSSGFTKMYNYQ